MKQVRSGSVTRTFTCPACGIVFSGVSREVTPKIERHTKYCKQMSIVDKQHCEMLVDRKMSFNQMKAGSSKIGKFGGYSNFMPDINMALVRPSEETVRGSGYIEAAASAAVSTNSAAASAAVSTNSAAASAVVSTNSAADSESSLTDEQRLAILQEIIEEEEAEKAKKPANKKSGKKKN